MDNYSNIFPPSNDTATRDAIVTFVASVTWDGGQTTPPMLRVCPPLLQGELLQHGLGSQMPTFVLPDPAGRVLHLVVPA